jgi:hypothetical protein
VTESGRFLAEEVFRQACSGQIPSEGDFIVRGPSGWFFGNSSGPSSPEEPTDPTAPGGGGGGGATSFSDLLGNILNVQVGTSAVTQHEASLEILYSQMLGFIPDSQVPKSAVIQWGDYIAVDSRNFKGELWDFVLSQVTTAVEEERIPASAVLQYVNEILETPMFSYMLSRVTSHIPWTSSDRCLANGALS